MTRLLVWNIRHGGGDRVPGILAFIDAQAPDAVVLTEYRDNKQGKAIEEHLSRNRGFECVHPSGTLPRVNSVLIAGRQPMQRHDVGNDLGPNAHRCCAIEIDGLLLVAFYFPCGKAKVPLFDFIDRHTRSWHSLPTLLCGDFNTGLHQQDEEGTTFIAANRFESLTSRGWVDVWRDRHRTTREFSWYSSKGHGFRIDHALASPSLAPRILSAEYCHVPRESAAPVSDHSALIVEIAETRPTSPL